MKRIATLVFLMISPLAASGQETEQAKEEHGRIARQIADLAEAEGDPERALLDIMAQQTEAIAKRLKLDAQGKQEFDGIVKEVMKDYPAELVMTKFTEAYASTYTTDELKGILAFYETDAGKAFLKKRKTLNSEMTRQIGTIALVIGQKIAMQIREKSPHLLKNAQPATRKAEEKPSE